MTHILRCGGETHQPPIFPALESLQFSRGVVTLFCLLNVAFQCGCSPSWWISKYHALCNIVFGAQSCTIIQGCFMVLHLLSDWFSRQNHTKLVLNLDDRHIWMKQICWWKLEIYEAVFHQAFCAMPLRFRHPLGFIRYDSIIQFAYSPSSKKLLLFFPLILWGQIFWHAYWSLYDNYLLEMPLLQNIHFS